MRKVVISIILWAFFIMPAFAEIHIETVVDDSNQEKIYINGKSNHYGKYVSINIYDREDNEKIYCLENSKTSLNGDFEFILNIPIGRTGIGKIAIDGEIRDVEINIDEDDKKPPIITVEGIVDGMEVTNAEISFKVEVEDNNDEEIKILAKANGKVLEEKLDGEYQVKLNRGENKIIIEAEDKAGNKAQSVYTVKYTDVVVEDKEPPTIKVSGIKDGMKVSEEEISFKVEVWDNKDEKVECLVKANGEIIEKKSNGKYRVKLNKGENEIIIEAEDKAGNRNEKTYKIEYKIKSSGGGSSSTKTKKKGGGGTGIGIQIVGSGEVLSFTDLSGYKWAEASIGRMCAKKIINGRGEEIFDPGASITRAEFAAMITRLLGKENSNSYKIDFKDVEKEKWYYESVKIVCGEGLMNGKANASFEPEEKITRQEMAVVVSNILKKKGYEFYSSTTTEFKDKDEIAPWALEGIKIAQENGIIKGSMGEFRPNEKLNRAQAAVIIDRLYELLSMPMGY
ncbi:S-layer homology domain-containing protein [Wukongibacter sp. M2B1]|uniref:S-layer homology domain-containing protein n=1 Tax=Wukongibacter sp. M2B1 TaxID=3088895 RepID=UPI003D79FDB5